MTRTCAIIVAAFKAQSTIMGCLKSIQDQYPLDGWKYDIRIGVDGCRDTGSILGRHKVPHYVGRENVGTYVMANSLIALGPADVFARFDADDYMLPHYLQTVIPLALKYGICHSTYRVGAGYSKPRVGQVTFTAATLDMLGGFHDARCHCDRDFTRRAADAGLDIQGMRNDSQLKQALFVKGFSSHSLTRCPEVGWGSKYRQRVKDKLAGLRAKGQIKITPKAEELVKCPAR